MFRGIDSQNILFPHIVKTMKIEMIQSWFLVCVLSVEFNPVPVQGNLSCYMVCSADLILIPYNNK